MPDLLGAHMSIAGGLYRALGRGSEAGCSVVQILPCVFYLRPASSPLCVCQETPFRRLNVRVEQD